MSQRENVLNLVWDTATLAWIRMQQPVVSTDTLAVSLAGVATAANQATEIASLSVLDDWDETDRAKVNPIAGQAGVQGASGVVTALTQRVVLATDVALPAGTNNIGDVDVLTQATAFGKTITYVNVNQTGAGTTVLAAADATKKHKIMGGAMTLSAAGTLALQSASTNKIGPFDFAANGGFVMSTSIIPYQETAVNEALNLVTTLGAARGSIAILTEA